MARQAYSHHERQQCALRKRACRRMGAGPSERNPQGIRMGKGRGREPEPNPFICAPFKSRYGAILEPESKASAISPRSRARCLQGNGFRSRAWSASGDQPSTASSPCSRAPRRRPLSVQSCRDSHAARSRGCGPRRSASPPRQCSACRATAGASRTVGRLVAAGGDGRQGAGRWLLGPVTAKLCKSAVDTKDAEMGLHPAQLWTESVFGKQLGPKVVAIATTLTGMRDPLDRRSVKSSPLRRRTPPGLLPAREMARTHTFAVTGPHRPNPPEAAGATPRAPPSGARPDAAASVAGAARPRS